MDQFLLVELNLLHGLGLGHDRFELPGLVNHPPHSFLQISSVAVYETDGRLGIAHQGPAGGEPEVAGDVGAAELLLESAVAAAEKAVNEEEGLEGDEAVSGLSQAARDSFGEESDGGGRVGDEEEDFMHVFVINGRFIMGGSPDHRHLYLGKASMMMIYHGLPNGSMVLHRPQSSPELALYVHPHLSPG